MNALSLGSVLRPYEIGAEEIVNGERVRPAHPLHRHDDHIAYMRPDKNGTLEVVADCDKHFVRLSLDELSTAVGVPCPRGCR